MTPNGDCLLLSLTSHMVLLHKYDYDDDDNDYLLLLVLLQYYWAYKPDPSLSELKMTRFQLTPLTIPADPSDSLVRQAASSSSVEPAS